MDARLMEAVNRFARAIGWLHPIATAYAGYGIVVLVALLLSGWWYARRSCEPRRMVRRNSDPSFPSGHASVAGAATVGLLLVSRLLAAATTMAPVLLAGARVYVGVHYPTDVLAGLLLGGLVAMLLYVLAHNRLARLFTAAGRSCLRPVFITTRTCTDGDR